MKLSLRNSSVFVLFSIALVSAAAKDAVLTKPCLMTKMMMTNGNKPIWKCILDPVDNHGIANHRLEIIGLTEKELMGAKSGVTYLRAIGAPISETTIDASRITNRSFQNAKRAVNNRVSGDRSVLAVRIISGDGATPYSRAEVIDNTFTDNVNLLERYAECSYNKLRFSAFTGTLNGITITDGVYDLTVSQSTSGADAQGIADSFIDDLTQDLGNSLTDEVDFIMFMMPSNIGGFGAFADFFGQFSWYDGEDAAVHSVTLVHELGHNLGLDHSGEGNDEYGDGTCRNGPLHVSSKSVSDTCSMGFGLNVDDFSVCFNPAKSWTLQWYADKHESLDIAFVGVNEYSLVGIAEYENAGDNSLIVKLDNSRGDDFFIGFNRAVGINQDQIEAVDQVTVIRTGGDDKQSLLVAKLDEGESFNAENVEIRVLSIDLTSSPSVARISVSSVGGGGGGGGGGEPPCFSGNNLVSVMGKGSIRMDAVEIGDYVRVGGVNDFSRVYGFLHLHRSLAAEYLLLHFEQGMSLEVSSKHLVFSGGKTIAAGKLRVGDYVDGEMGDKRKIVEIESTHQDGVFAPATESGDIVVSGVRASNYVDLLENSLIEHHTMSHAFLFPVRMYCKLNFSHCKEQTYTQEGYSHWVKFFIWISEALNRYGGPILQCGTTFIIAPLIAALTILDGLFLLKDKVLMTGVAVAAAVATNKVAR